MLRRGLALGLALIVLILLVLGVKGCLDARADRQLSDYARNVAQIVEETQQTSNQFFEMMEEPGDLSVQDFTNEVKADRSAMDNYAARIDGLDSPGDMAGAQEDLELVYELRSAAMNAIANRMSTALGEAGAEKAIEAITRQMRVLAASDVLYETLTRPEINTVLTENGIEGSDVPASTYVPGGTRWLEPGNVSSALATVSGAAGGEAATPGVHGLGLVTTALNGTELAEEVPVTVSAAEGVEAEIQVQNQGESEESGVGVTVSYGGNTVKETINSIETGEIVTVTIPLTPTPQGTVELEVKVDTVPGEKVAENNEATYSVSFE